MHQRLLILDYGSQLTQLIARRLREAGVYCEVYPGNSSPAFIQTQFDQGLKGIILSGSHASAYGAASLQVPELIFELGIPVLGICYGMQAMAHQLGGQVAPAHQAEFGFAEVKIEHPGTLLQDIKDYQDAQGERYLKVWMSHGDQVTQLPPGFTCIASTASCPIAAMADESRCFYGLQFHPEATHTLQGATILARFVHQICGCVGDWNMPDYVDELIVRIRQQVGEDEVLLALSGGVDSSVAAALIHRAIGPRLTCVFVDHGLLRANEAEQVMQTYAQAMGIHIVYVDASSLFLHRLAGVIDPESKRKIIGRTFIDVFHEESVKLKNAHWLAQGTIYPDVIESARAQTGQAVTIKSHHNVGGLPESLNLKLLEPLRELFKDEVRQLGVALGLPVSMVYRHPFPGPGLAVRILGEVKPEYAEYVRQADAIFIQELRQTIDSASGQSWYELTSQAFAVFLPIQSVGVMGDTRTYDFVVSLRAVQTTDFMTANWAPLPYDLLEKVSTRIINEVKGINRVVYDISSKPPATIEWE